MHLELSDIDDSERRLTRTERWRVALFAVSGILVVMGIGAAELLLMG
jgi:hypothetical protein